MNRIKLGLLADSEHPEVDQWINAQKNESPNQQPASPPPLAFEHSVFLPAHFEERYQYPLVIWLHNECADHDQLVDVMPGISDRNFLGVSIRGTHRAGPGFGWHQTPGAIEFVANQIQDCIEVVGKRYRINQQRIFVAGAGCGGTMAFRIAFQNPELFCGVASFNGPLPMNSTPLLNLRASRRVPVFWVHGRTSFDLPEIRLCGQLKLLHIGGFDVTLRQYPGGDQLEQQPLFDFNTWMMEQIAAQPGSGIVL